MSLKRLSGDGFLSPSVCNADRVSSSDTNSGWTLEPGPVAPPAAGDSNGRKRLWGSGARQQPDSVSTILPRLASFRLSGGMSAAVWIAAIDAANSSPGAAFWTRASSHSAMKAGVARETRRPD